MYLVGSDGFQRSLEAEIRDIVLTFILLVVFEILSQ